MQKTDAKGKTEDYVQNSGNHLVRHIRDTDFFGYVAPASLGSDIEFRGIAPGDQSGDHDVGFQLARSIDHWIWVYSGFDGKTEKGGVGLVFSRT